MGLIYKTFPVKGDKGEREVRVLMDTGVSHNVIRAGLAHELATAAPLPRSISAQFARGAGEIRETVNLALLINGQDVITSALVLEDLSEDFILGAEFFQRFKVILDPEHEEIRFTDPEALKVKILSAKLDEWPLLQQRALHPG